eukprot:gb/GFBE01069709.1/.p1 GENE.gb/GFBE01069709.1/~~gb/GFBE01069709.1/.p1  ORF type:complete len:749 (+),score=136.80 gb/GFBE01069709.1/:1-2247(+)
MQARHQEERTTLLGREVPAAWKPEPIDPEAPVTATTTPGTTPGTGTTPGVGVDVEAPLREAASGAGISVREIATPYVCLPICSAASLLTDVSKLMLSSGRKAVRIQQTQDIITEDDILQSYLRGAPWDANAAELARGLSKAAARPGSGAAGRDVQPDQPLKEALPLLLQPVTGSFSSRVVPSWGHVKVLKGNTNDDFNGGLLALQDIVRAVTQLEEREQELMGELGFDPSVTVAQVMASLTKLPRCAAGSTMQRLVWELLRCPSRLALLTDKQQTCWLATSADALWAFSQEQSLSSDAWETLAGPGRLHMNLHTVPIHASLKHAAKVLMASKVKGAASIQSLLVADKRGKVQGVISAHDFVKQAQLPTLQQPREEQETERLPEKAATAPQEQHALTIADLAAERETPTCTPAQTLVKAAADLVEVQRTAAIVTDDRGGVRGVLTENDVLTALVSDAPWDCSIDAWLRGDDARLPGFIVPALTLKPQTSLAEAAATICDLVQTGDEGFAMHHVLVTGDTSDSQSGPSTRAAQTTYPPRNLRLLSVLDIARGLLEATQTHPRATDEASAAAVVAADMKVAQAMKDRSDVPSCVLSDSMADAFEAMCKYHQNCVLVVPEKSKKEGGRVYGIVTAGDALHSFALRSTGERVILAKWLRTLDPQRQTDIENRGIPYDATLAEAAQTMVESNVHHLVVVGPMGHEVVGILSALDIVCALGANYIFEQASPRASEVQPFLSIATNLHARHEACEA